MTCTNPNNEINLEREIPSAFELSYLQAASKRLMRSHAEISFKTDYHKWREIGFRLFRSMKIRPLIAVMMGVKPANHQKKRSAVLPRRARHPLRHAFPKGNHHQAATGREEAENTNARHQSRRDDLVCYEIRADGGAYEKLNALTNKVLYYRKVMKSIIKCRLVDHRDVTNMGKHTKCATGTIQSARKLRCQP